jgi:hypothetical protein
MTSRDILSKYDWIPFKMGKYRDCNICAWSNNQYDCPRHKEFPNTVGSLLCATLHPGELGYWKEKIIYDSIDDYELD